MLANTLVTKPAYPTRCLHLLRLGHRTPLLFAHQLLGHRALHLLYAILGIGGILLLVAFAGITNALIAYGAKEYHSECHTFDECGHEIGISGLEVHRAALLVAGLALLDHLLYPPGGVGRLSRGACSHPLWLSTSWSHGMRIPATPLRCAGHRPNPRHR